MRSLDDDSFIFLLLYVNDMLITSNHLCDVNELKSLLSKEFDMKDLGPSKKILEIEIFSGIGNPNDYGSHNKVMLRRC